MSGKDDINIGALAKVYLKIRAAEQAVQKKYDEELEGLKEQRSAIASAMKEQLLAMKAQSIKTDAGLVMLKTKTRYYPSDWQAFYGFVKQHDALELLERRVAQGNMAKYLEDNPGDLPPGMNVDTEYEISVRKP